MGETHYQLFRRSFQKCLCMAFQGSRVTSDLSACNLSTLNARGGSHAR
jgi:hypothetical protein